MSTAEHPESQRAQRARLISDVVAKTVEDEEFRARVQSNPVAVLREAGIDVPDGMVINVLQESPNRAFLVLPHPSTVHRSDLDGTCLMCGQDLPTTSA